jgi:uncharacterized membrane protein SpoIIM required for sporulation
MRETKFIEQNKEKWAEYESMLQNEQAEPEKLNDLFVQITDDLSYARTFYPNRSVKVYLNQMAQRIFHHIYNGRRFPKERLWQFWTDDIPQVMWESRNALRLALALFVLSFVIGIISSQINPDFARVVLGDNYVDMTLSNIQKGDPMAVYKDNQPLGSALGIAANNLFVAFRTAILGVLASLGTAFMLMYNGIMVGAFQYFFVSKGLFWESFLTIWIHGTLEISAIILAGGAGLMAGSGLLFPGTFTRTQAFQISMRQGMKIFIGITPIIILAAMFEGFLTRFTEVPDPLRALFIGTNLLFVLWYFVYLPRQKARNGEFAETAKDSDLPPQQINPISFTSIKSAGEIISDTFSIVKRNLQWTFAGSIAASLIFTLVVLYRSKQDISTYRIDGVKDLDMFLGETVSDPQRLLMMGLMLFVGFVGLRMVEMEMPAGYRRGFGWKSTLRTLPMVVPIMGILSYLTVGSTGSLFFILITRIFILTPVFFAPFALCAYWAAGIRYGTLNPLPTIWRMFQSLRSWTPFLIGLFIVGLSALLILFLNSELWTIFVQFFSWAVPPGEDHVATFSGVITVFFIAQVLFFSWLLLIISGVLHFYTHREIVDAPHLLQQIETVGTVKQIRGLPKE